MNSLLFLLCCVVLETQKQMHTNTPLICKHMTSINYHGDSYKKQVRIKGHMRRRKIVGDIENE